MTVAFKRFPAVGRGAASLFVVAFVTMGLLAAPAEAQTSVPAVPVQAVSSCPVLDELDGEPDLSTVMDVIRFCPDALALSAGQRDQFAILQSAYVDGILRREARRLVIEASLLVLLRVDPDDPGRPVDVVTAEVKIRELERMAVEDQITTLRLVEASKAVLTGAQRATLAALLRRARGDATPKVKL